MAVRRSTPQSRPRERSKHPPRRKPGGSSKSRPKPTTRPTRLRAEQAAAAQAIEAAEARITSADAQARLASIYVAAHRRQLVDQQRPAALLLAGLAVMARRPPLLALAADGGNTDELVKIRILLDSTLPAIRARTDRISSELERGRQLQQALVNARAETFRSQQDLVAKRQKFAALESKALEQAVEAGGQALVAGDIALAVGEQAEQLEGGKSSQRSSAALADALTAEDTGARPSVAGRRRAIPPHRSLTQLPAVAPVTEGLGSVDANGMRSRGLTLGTGRGAPVAIPAYGIVRFAGPFRDYDGVLIIDHGGGWISLLVNVSSSCEPGEGAAGRPGWARSRAVAGRIVPKWASNLACSHRRFISNSVKGRQRRLGA